MNCMDARADEGRCLCDELTSNFFDIIRVNSSNNIVEDAMGHRGNCMERIDSFHFEFVELFDSFQ